MASLRLPLGRVVALVRGSLSAKLAMFYGLLFALAVVLILGGVKAGISTTAERMVRSEMLAGTQVFDRVTAMRYAQLGDASTILAGDFGFRSAAATGDAPTIVSALDSLRSRLRLDQAFFVDAQGDVIGYRGQIPARDAERLYAALDDGRTRGVLRLGDTPFNAAAAVVKAPVTIGWVVFGNRIDANELARLSKLSSIDLRPRIVPVATLDADQRSGTAIERTIDGNRMLVQASPIASFLTDEPQALLLRYSITDALADYRPMLWLLLGCGILGVGLAGTGSLLLARRITKPIVALDAAARRVSRGDYTHVDVTMRDELGSLATSFNRMIDDIGERERQITHMALHDHLTGLANRVLLRDHLSKAIARRSSGRRQALFCLDLDQFKVVNDTLGHPTGDALLCEIAGRLSTFAGDGFVARLGGDEFAVVLDDGQRPFDRLAHELIRVVAEPCMVNGHRIVPGTSVGIAILGVDGADAVTLTKNADLALYRAKHAGRGGFRFFEVAMDAEARKRRQMELDLHDAIAGGQLSLMFQPLFNLSETRVCALEALLRWNHPERGMVSPVDFIRLVRKDSTALADSLRNSLPKIAGDLHTYLRHAGHHGRSFEVDVPRETISIQLRSHSEQMTFAQYIDKVYALLESVLVIQWSIANWLEISGVEVPMDAGLASAVGLTPDVLLRLWLEEGKRVSVRKSVIENRVWFIEADLSISDVLSTAVVAASRAGEICDVVEVKSLRSPDDVWHMNIHAYEVAMSESLAAGAGAVMRILRLRHSLVNGDACALSNADLEYAAIVIGANVLNGELRDLPHLREVRHLSQTHGAAVAEEIAVRAIRAVREGTADEFHRENAVRLRILDAPMIPTPAGIRMHMRSDPIGVHAR